MPTYEYKCKECDKVFELFQSITDKPIKRCKFCKGEVVRLIGTGGGIIFKGNGFYATDYRKGDYKDKQKKESAPASCPAGGCKGCPNSKE